ncbi:MAG: hypothetical protein Q9162_006715 [Coniocarpon cinnabarinum]
MAVSSDAPDPTTTSLASDKALRPFLAPTFDPADYLNATLPAWTPSSRPLASAASLNSTQASSLTDLTTQTQTLLSQLSAQLTRLSAQLTKFTDEILRSGGRLAYEVEILRGETGSLSDVLVDGLAEDLSRFVPGGLKPMRRRSSTARSTSTVADIPRTNLNEQQQGEPKSAQDAITRLRTLALVRDRLDSVVQVFGAALDWPVAPSEVNMRSTFISVAGPEAEDTEEREKKGKSWVEGKKKQLGDVQVKEGYEAALARLEELEELAEVWKGTSEEKARLKVVESLRKSVEERRKGKVGGGYGVR